MPSALAQGLAAAAPLAAAAVPPPPAPPAPVEAVRPGGNGALQQAIQIMGAGRTAANADPLMSKAMAAYDQDMAAKAEAAKKLEANMGQVQAIEDQPLPARPAVPQLKELPAAPVPEKKDPLRVFQQVMPMLAALGALATQTPAVAALNAATAMVNAAKANDKEEEATQRQAWIDNLNTTVRENQDLVSEYNLILNDRTATVADRQARIQALAAQQKDVLTLAALKGGNMEPIVNLMKMRETAAGQLADVTTKLMSEANDQKKWDEQRTLQWAQLEIDRRRAGNVSMGDAIGGVLMKMQSADPAKLAQGLDKVLSAGEILSLKTYMDINAGQRFGAQPGAAAGGVVPGLAAPGGAAPAALPGPAQPAAAAASVAPKPATPSVTAAPQNPKDRVTGTLYATPQGNLIWRGTGWERPPAP